MDISIIIVNYNTSKLTIQSIESIYKFANNLKFEIILVDNASEKDELKILKEFINNKKEIKLYENITNSGFAAGNNLGLKYFQGEYVLFLNSDTKLISPVIVDVITWIKSHPKTGVASVTLLNEDGTKQRNGGFVPNLFSVALWMWFIEDLPFIGSLIKTFHPMPANAPRRQDWVTGAFMLMPKKVINDVGNMSEDYFMYTEDVDYCYQIKKKGWEIWYLPQFSIIHLGGASGKFGEGLVKEFISLKIFFKKHYPKWQMPILNLFLLSGALVRMLLFGILKGKRAFNIYAKVIREI